MASEWEREEEGALHTHVLFNWFSSHDKMWIEKKEEREITKKYATLHVFIIFFNLALLGWKLEILMNNFNAIWCNYCFYILLHWIHNNNRSKWMNRKMMKCMQKKGEWIVVKETKKLLREGTCCQQLRIIFYCSHHDLFVCTFNFQIW